MINILFITSTLLFQSLPFDQSEPRTMVVFNGDYGGCQSIFVYRATDDKTKALLVHIDRQRLKVSNKPKAYQIGSTPGLEVLIEDYGRYKHNEYCSDFLKYAQKPQRVYARGGTVTAFILTSKHLERRNRRFAVTVQLKDVSFPTSGGTTYHVENAAIKNVLVGWIP